MSAKDSTSEAPRQRWIKVGVPESVFYRLHELAAQSNMRLTPYLVRLLSEAQAHPIAVQESREASQFADQKAS